MNNSESIIFSESNTHCLLISVVADWLFKLLKCHLRYTFCILSVKLNVFAFLYLFSVVIKYSGQLLNYICAVSKNSETAQLKCVFQVLK